MGWHSLNYIINFSDINLGRELNLAPNLFLYVFEFLLYVDNIIGSFIHSFIRA